MRVRVLVPALLALFLNLPAQAAIQIDIDKDTQTMTVVIDGVARHRWPVSSGLPAHETPNGSHKAFRMEEDHYSREWDEAPMPHSIFFTKRGHAIHGTDAVRRLGNPASHGCVRLSRANAATLFALVKASGLSSTTVTLSGSSQVALARGPQRANEVAARLPPPQQLAPPVDEGGFYDDYGRWVPGGQVAYRRGYPAESGYAAQPPAYPTQQINPYAPRGYAQQPYQQQPYAGQVYGGPYAQPRPYRQRDVYDNYGY